MNESHWIVEGKSNVGPLGRLLWLSVYLANEAKAMAVTQAKPLLGTNAVE